MSNKHISTERTIDFIYGDNVESNEVTKVAIFLTLQGDVVLISPLSIDPDNEMLSGYSDKDKKEVINDMEKINYDMIDMCDTVVIISDKVDFSEKANAIIRRANMLHKDVEYHFTSN